MPKAYFISDAHLGLGNKETEAKKETLLISLFDHIKKEADSLYILGDLFDAWFEYKTVIPRGFHRTITKLDELVRNNIKVHYLAGNHDYWMDNFFSNDLGINVHFDAFDMVLDGKKIYMHHGDGFTTNDHGYNILKKILRCPFNIKLYRMLHPDLGVTLAKKISRTSRKHSSNKHFGEEDGMKKAAQRKIQEGYDIVIMGHRHEPSFQKIGNGLYVNLGDWISHFSYAEMSDGVIALNKWSSSK